MDENTITTIIEGQKATLQEVQTTKNGQANYNLEEDGHQSNKEKASISSIAPEIDVFKVKLDASLGSRQFRSQSVDVKKGANYLLDQRELNELISIDVQSIALQKVLTSANSDSPRSSISRKNSDDDYFVEETLLFTFSSKEDPIDLSYGDSASPKKDATSSLQPDKEQYLQVLGQPVAELKRRLLIEIHHCFDGQVENPEILSREKRTLDLMSTYQDDPDAEIDKLLETFKMSGNFKNDILNGEFIENDIRLSEAIRESIEDIKTIQKVPLNKKGDMEKRRFLGRYTEVAELLGVSFTVEHLLPALLEIFKSDYQDGNDRGFTKLIFNGLEHLINFLSSSEITIGYNGLRDYIMPMLYDFFQADKVADNVKQEIQTKVMENLVRATSILTTEDRTDKVLPIILDNIKDDSDEERRILGLEMIDRLAEMLGQEVCQSYLMYEIVSLQDDSVYRVRKETVARMINISKVLGKEIFLKILFPVFKKLSNDSIWGVRRSAVEMLPQISMICPIEIKNGVLIDIFKKFSQDTSKWVKQAMFQYLGPFIATYQGIDPNPLLVDSYIGMLQQNKSTSPDNEVPYHCAYNFPAVLLTLGTKFWPKLKPLYESLIKDNRAKVRRTLSFSLHEVAKLLGPDLVEKELMHVLLLFMKDIEEVKEGVNNNLPKFIETLPVLSRERFLDKVKIEPQSEKDWRKRSLMAKQIRQFSKVFSAATVSKQFVPSFFALCNDQVAEVRVAAAKATRNLLLKLAPQPELLQDFMDKIEPIKNGQKFFIRQTYIQMCESVMNLKKDFPIQRALFEQHFLQPLISFKNDRVVNVRMQLADTLAAHYIRFQESSLIEEIESLKKLVLDLKGDQSRDVKEALVCVPERILILSATAEEQKSLPEEEQSTEVTEVVIEDNNQEGNDITKQQGINPIQDPSQPQKSDHTREEKENECCEIKYENEAVLIIKDIIDKVCEQIREEFE